MSTMIVEVYEALKAAGAPEDKAQAAASVLADSFPAKEDLSQLATKADLADVRAEMHAIKADLLKWVIGAIGFQIIVTLGAIVSLAKILAK